MEITDEDVSTRLQKVAPAARRRDAETLLALMGEATGASPRVWSGGIIGFGTYHYRYESGTEGDSPAVGFAARKNATTVYLADGVGAHADALATLGDHSTGVGCLYLKDLGKVDLDVLRGIVATAFQTLTAGTYGKRARQGGAGV
ncbi:DUF1801 domain-containing protein [Microbacterium sp.]|uniref:DUF1801 domain-containing protein n=1 Tax=Microbacterium sp. TaxID=51671 RepID=UPI0039E53675